MDKEIEMLNADDLDIEELERRVELASAAPLDDPDGGCLVYWTESA